MSVTDEQPDRAATIANTLAQAFSNLIAQLEQPLDPTRPPLVAARMIEPASPPTQPTSPSLLLNLALGGVLGLALGATIAIVRDTLDTSIDGIESLKQNTSAPALGIVPEVPAESKTSGQQNILLRTSSNDPAAEALRKIRTNFDFLDIDRQQKVVAITSSVAGEGKSTIACGLASALAATGRRTVIVDADLRRPAIAEYLGLVGDVGLTSVMAGRVPLSRTIQRWPSGAVSIVPSGPIPPNPNELLASQQMQDVVSELRRNYDVILIDTPPLVAVADAAQVATIADGAILVCAYKSTSVVDVVAATEALRSVQARLLGCVLNMGPEQTSAYYGSYNGGGGRADRALGDTDAEATIDERQQHRMPEAGLNRPSPSRRSSS
ncbi:polysaccharide biosynthesis tyrosine autokinase [Actinomycetospora callitridis]|uniref:polysaccharide biosynthesis tyrosine autokinase n=1 Tax=Actinomycetospora callitridis TaxID=913944 RepID=UPI0023660515|nr:polysaccharide biosynthesis tyrosine autokinase [Actinomycetospora callitridis]MDD7917648.1 formate--tetrahydrofolate ligase [Actinomycetospora callitridis]